MINAGTPEERWRGGRLAALAEVDAPGAGDRIVVVAAHPDDETLGAGGLMAAATARGASISVVIATDGEASHPDSPTHTPSELARIRRAEVRSAVAVLSPSAAVRFLGLPDSALASCPAQLSTALSEHLVHCTLAISPWQGDRHPDHAACATAVAEIVSRLPDARHWQYPIWAWHWADPDSPELPWPLLRRFQLSHTVRTAKQTALHCHRSQHSPLSEASGDEAILPPAVLAHFARTFESFVVEPAPAAASGYFERLYGRSDDPWGLVDRFYERRKRALLLAALPRPRFHRVFEPGCATGELSVELAARCDELVAWDGATSAVRRAGSRLDGALVEQRRIPDDWPDGSFDLIVLSEVGYYCANLDTLALRVTDSLASDGVLVGCHWRRPAPDHPHGAAAVHAAISEGLHRIVAHQEDDFLLDVWSRSPASVAAWEGIVR